MPGEVAGAGSAAVVAFLVAAASAAVAFVQQGFAAEAFVLRGSGAAPFAAEPSALRAWLEARG
jgi:hypothetical protein